MTMLKRKEMNIAVEMHYELNASAFAYDFDAIGNEHDQNNHAHSRIGMPIDMDK